MVWDDTPMYERNREPKAENLTVVKRGVPWAYEVLGKSRGIPTGAPSPIYAWFHREAAKRAKGQDNEIDRAEIIQAAKGVRNKWSDRYKANPAKFKPIVNPMKDESKVDWADVLADIPSTKPKEEIATAKSNLQLQKAAEPEIPIWCESVANQEEVEFLPEFGQNEDSSWIDAEMADLSWG